MTPLRSTIDRWRLTVTLLARQPLPALPPIPGRVHRQEFSERVDAYAEAWNQERPDRAEPVECHQPRGRPRNP